MHPALATPRERPRPSAGLLARVLVDAFLENVHDFVYFKDRQSRYLALSQSLVRCFGCTHPIEVIGRTNFDFFAPENAQASFDDEQEIIRTGRPLVDKVEQKIFPDGRTLWLSMTKLALRDEHGEIIGTFGVSRDISHARQLSHELGVAQKSLLEASRTAGMAEVATGVLHNVGNVLSSLNVSATMISAGLRGAKAESLAKVAALLREHRADLAAFVTDDPKGRKVPGLIASLAAHAVSERERLLAEIGSLQTNIDHIKEIVTMQQAYATAAGQVEALAAVPLMEDALRMNSGALVRHDVRVVREFSFAPAVLGEKGKILQILVNLIRNAKYACDDGPHTEKVITLRLEHLPAANAEGSSRVRFLVRDNGVGIPAENLTRIFAHGFTTRKHGHGFGLHSSANAAREMKGALIAASDGPGRGATFTLDLPAAPPALPRE
jgi:PAS domain S-box-containing protein